MLLLLQYNYLCIILVLYYILEVSCMHVKITIFTASGSVYELRQLDGKFLIDHKEENSLSSSGEIVKIYRELRIGNPLYVDFIQEATPSSSRLLHFLRTSPIVDIVIK